MGFHENLKLLLNGLNLKQADLCRMTGIQTSLMSDYLGGKKSPTIGNAILIADALHISLDTLVGKKTDDCRNKVIDTKPVTELDKAIVGLTEDEQNFLLDIIKSMRHRLKN